MLNNNTEKTRTMNKLRLVVTLVLTMTDAIVVTPAMATPI